jgi:hypothetical protein
VVAALIALILGAALFGGGLLVGWTLRDRAGVAAGEKPVLAIEPPVPDPIIPKEFLGLEDDDE